MRFFRRRSDRPDAARRRLGSSLETLETRVVLSQSNLSLFAVYTPTDLHIQNPITHKTLAYSVENSIRKNPTPSNPNLTNEGKLVSGKDLAGDEWTITVHGPGYVIVTDTTPSNGVLENTIATIQLVGTDINKTYVTGTVTSSARLNTTGTVEFNRLIDSSGVNSIILNGFTLTQTVPPAAGQPNNVTTGIFLTGGVRTLQFHDIFAPIDTATLDAPINVVIGDPSTPTTVQPSIKIDSIANTVFNSTTSGVQGTTPQTNPTVNIIVNGQVKSLDITSMTQQNIDAALQYQFPIVGTTGRTSVQAIGINKLNVRGAATNFTASRSSVPFQNGFTGLSHLNKATFHGPADAVGLDVNGAIGKLTFKKGLGDPTGVFVGTTTTGSYPGAQVPATMYGIPAGTTGYPASGYLGGQVTAKKIGKLTVGPASQNLITPTNPDFQQLRGTWYQTYVALPGNALTNVAITSDSTIGKTKIVGTNQNTEIKAGFNYNSFAAGLEGTRAASKIGPYHQKGSLINAVTSSTYRPASHYYGAQGSVAGPGKVTGRLTGSAISTGAITPLTNRGAGVYARVKKGYLPPPSKPTTSPNGPVS